MSEKTAHEFIADVLAGEAFKPMAQFAHQNKEIVDELVSENPEGLPRIIHITLDGLARVAAGVINESPDDHQAKDMFLRLLDEALTRT